MSNYKEYTRIYRGFTGKQYLFHLRENTVDYNSVYASLVQNQYCLDEFGLVDGDVVFDIGAYIGEEVVAFATIGPKLKIYAIEPVPDNLELIKKNISSNTYADDIVIISGAVGEKDGKTRIYYGGHGTRGEIEHHFVGNAVQEEDSLLKNLSQEPYIEVDQYSLDTLFSKYKIEKVRLIKTDCEGGEIGFFKGASLENLKKIDWIK